MGKQATLDPIQEAVVDGLRSHLVASFGLELRAEGRIFNPRKDEEVIPSVTCTSVENEAASFSVNLEVKEGLGRAVISSIEVAAEEFFRIFNEKRDVPINFTLNIVPVGD